MQRFRSYFLSLVYLFGFVLPAVAASQAEAYFPAGSPASDAIHFEYAIYLLNKPAKSPLEEAKRKLATLAPGLKLVPEPVSLPKERQVTMRLEQDVAKNYAPPTPQVLQYFARGLSKEQAAALQSSPQALVLYFGHPKREVWRGLQGADALLEQLARDMQGLIWDEETREIFTPDEWRARRMSSWQGDLPDVSKHTVIHAYKDNDYIRAITLGMRKVGMPDIYVAEFPWSASRPMGNLINALAQALAEGASIQADGKFDLRLDTLKQAAARRSQLADLKPNATKSAQLTLYVGKHDQGDPENRLIRIDPARYPGPDVHARLDKMLASLYGSQDSLTRVKHDDLLLKTSAQARTQLPSLRSAFVAGLKPGEFIQLKAPFKTSSGGNEWMWVEVIDWANNGAIKGLLKNEPFEVPGLHAGQTVQISQQEVFDYLRRYPDGREEGNETGKVILKMQGQGAK